MVGVSSPINMPKLSMYVGETARTKILRGLESGIDVDTLIRTVTTLTQEVAALKKSMEDLQLQLQYAPGGPAYEAAKSDFEKHVYSEINSTT